MEINYLTDPVEDYKKAVNEAKDVVGLINAIYPYKEIADDALKIAIKILDKIDGYDWWEYIRGLNKERRKIFAGEEWAKKYGPILLPEIMVEISLVALQFVVPWGTAFIRMKEEGLIKKENNIYVLV